MRPGKRGMAEPTKELDSPKKKSKIILTLKNQIVQKVRRIYGYFLIFMAQTLQLFFYILTQLLYLLRTDCTSH